MKLDPEYYLHESDKAALSALKAIPGFPQVLKAFMKIWNEQQFKITNMSSNLKLGPDQLPRYYDMLPPICDKLGIDVPELYIKTDVYPNSYTYGDTAPIIVLTTGLLKILPEELIPTVLAHECGHIACRHTLYITMGRILRDAVIAPVVFAGLGNIAMIPITAAFAYWMRCSEFSADRAAVICDGGADNTIKACMCFAGFDKDFPDTANVDAFIAQADGYKSMVGDSAFNKTMELVTFAYVDHPLNAVRALESREWAKTERFRNITEWLRDPQSAQSMSFSVELSPAKYVGKNISDVQTDLVNKGFTNITSMPVKDDTPNMKNGAVMTVSVNGIVNGGTDLFRRDSVICITYFAAKTEEELAAEHVNDVRMTESAAELIGRDFFEVKLALQKMGFTRISSQEVPIPKLMSLVAKVNSVSAVTVNGQPFEKGAWFPPDANVVIHYYVRGM